jgi:integrase/recombinase XerC
MEDSTQGLDLVMNDSGLQDTLARYQKYLEESSFLPVTTSFLARRGALSVRSVHRLVNTYAQAAGLDNVSTYTLRQTCGQHLLKDTGDLSLVARLMGHKRLETALKYILPRQEDLTEVAEKSSLNLY